MKQNIKDYLIITAGAFIYSISVAIFTSPNNIAPGGLTGIATMLNYLFSLPIGTFILIMNVPLLFWGYKTFGKGFFARTIAGTILVSLFIDIVTPLVTPYKGEVILASIFGGMLNGIGIALIFSRGGSTGGTDIIATSIHKSYPHISIGSIILISDAVIIIIAAFVYKSIESALYAVIAIFVSTKLIDTITYGTSRNNGKLMLIITGSYKEILDSFLANIPRGVTLIDAKGGYSGKDKKLLICALRPNQVFRANTIAKSIDPDAFIIITTANTINGAGFVNKHNL